MEQLGYKQVPSKYRLGVDAGGTFTDFVLAEINGAIRLFKSPSTPEDGTRAIADGLAQISAAMGMSPQDIISQCDLCINGTTVALNALIELKGAKVGLLCTAGHEDSLEIRLGHKEEGHRYDPDFPPAPVLVPRYLRRPVRGRILADGSEYEPLHEEDILEAIAIFRREGVESVAISFLWSVTNPAHERRARELIEQHLPGVFVCCGSEVHPQVREYTRTSTTVVNAYLSPVMGRYVQKIDRFFADLGARNPVRYYQSNGGLALGSIMRERAVNAINSGPASAPQAALYIAEPFSINNVITVDMGGTSFDITMAKDGQTKLIRNYDFLRQRLGVPMIHVETLGAGGGSIAQIDEFGMIRVGPRSAGVYPGPACYGRGGSQPTVTDANLVLGYMRPNAVLGGAIRLDPEKAKEAVQTHIATPLRIGLERAAFGIHTLVNTNMSNGIRRISIEQGYDPRDFALVCAGGATGMHITGLAEELGIETVLVPKAASCLCALGQVISDVKYNYLASLPMRLDGEVDISPLRNLFAEMEEKGKDLLRGSGFPEETLFVERSVEMRYVGQIHECTVPIPDGPISTDTLRLMIEAFHARHEALYTYSEPQNPVELINLECTVGARIRKPPLPQLESGEEGVKQAHDGFRGMIFDDSGIRVETPVYLGERLRAGNRIIGPAAIEEPTTTIILRPGWQAELDASGTYKLTRWAE